MFTSLASRPALITLFPSQSAGEAACVTREQSPSAHPCKSRQHSPVRDRLCILVGVCFALEVFGPAMVEGDLFVGGGVVDDINIY